MILQFFKYRLHPLLYVTIAYIGGICLPLSLPISIILVSLTAIAVGLLSQHLSFLTKHSALLTILCSIAYAIGSVRITHQRNIQEGFFAAWQKSSCSVIANVTNIDPVDHLIYNRCITLACSKIQQGEKLLWTSTDATIQIYTKNNASLQSLHVGDIIAVDNLTFKEPNNQKFGDYLIKEGVTTTLFFIPFSYTTIERPQYSYTRWLFYTKNDTVARIKKKISPRTFQLFASIFLGNKQSPKKLTEKTKDHFTTWGVTHYLARSGLHMVIFVFVWQLLLNLLPLPWAIKEIIMIGLGLAYCLLSWSSVSFNRALLTFLLYKCCTLMRLQTNFLHLLILVCLLILLHNPMQLFFLDFQLSFGLTFALACFNQIKIHHKHQRHHYKTIAS